MSDTLKQVREFKINKLKELLAQCTEQQQAFFFKMYPGGPEGVTDAQYNWAVSQCETTIKNNKEKTRDE